MKKMGEQHLVPLSWQAIVLLNELQPLAREGATYPVPSLTDA
jgi:hypothetical protein